MIDKIIFLRETLGPMAWLIFAFPIALIIAICLEIYNWISGGKAYKTVGVNK